MPPKRGNHWTTKNQPKWSRNHRGRLYHSRNYNTIVFLPLKTSKLSQSSHSLTHSHSLESTFFASSTPGCCSVLWTLASVRQIDSFWWQKRFYHYYYHDGWKTRTVDKDHFVESVALRPPYSQHPSFAAACFS